MSEIKDEVKVEVKSEIKSKVPTIKFTKPMTRSSWKEFKQSSRKLTVRLPDFHAYRYELKIDIYVPHFPTFKDIQHALDTQWYFQLKIRLIPKIGYFHPEKKEMYTLLNCKHKDARKIRNHVGYIPKNIHYIECRDYIDISNKDVEVIKILKDM